MDKEYKIFLNSQLEMPYYKKINSFLKNEIRNNKIIYPKQEDLFRAFDITPFQEMKVVIFGQDPYHYEGAADGLAFSTKLNDVPKSLANIFKEIKKEYSGVSITSNDLTPWAKQGVLLLNACLSVEKGKPNIHSKIGWNIFIQNFIEYLNQNKEFLIFILWGKQARELKKFISPKFYILESSHPSPFSANKSFFGNNHFKKTNELINEKKLPEINWNL